jgi:hypothetical protein
VTTSESTELVIMPSRRSQMKMVGGASLLIVASVSVAANGEGAERAVGVLGALFFLWALGSFWWRFRKRAAIVLSPTGLRLPLGGEIPWEDLAEVGVVKYKRVKHVGLRLQSTERFLASFTDQERAALARYLKTARLFSGGISAAQLATFKPTDLTSYEVLIDDDRKALSKIAMDPSLKGVTGFIALARKEHGYDWALGPIELDRSPAKFAALLNEQRARFLGDPSPCVASAQGRARGQRPQS